MMEEMQIHTDESYDSLDEHYDRPAERWAPLGAAASSPVPPACEQSHVSQADYLQKLEDEQDMLNSSLLALTTHFAQIQFRLKQVVAAEPEEKEVLLKDLEEFAFKGIPDVRGMTIHDAQIIEEVSDKQFDSRMAEQRQKQQELIQQLKSQLEDLETYAYEMGDAELPTSKVMEKQRVILDQLQQTLDLKDLEQFDRLSPEQLRQLVDNAIGQIVNPAKVKEKLVDQLKTQIVDLERFISFLQGDVQSPGPHGEKCTCPVHGGSSTKSGKSSRSPSKRSPEKIADKNEHSGIRDQTLTIMRRALALLQVFAITQFGCGGKEFQKNVLKRTTKGNHWGDLRARLEVSIDRVVDLVKRQEHAQPIESDYTSDTEDAPVIQCNQELATAVRKELAASLRDLLQHGLMEIGQSQNLVLWGACFPSRSRAVQTKMMHAWDLLLKYYEMKHGKEYNETPARKLSSSFDLNIVGGKAVTAKQTLLSAIEEVQTTHVPLRRSEDSQFKAFVCSALNERKLVPWLRLILKTNSLVEFYYQPWSYVIKTGFDDALRSLDRLTKIHFTLPVDLAVRPFTHMQDAF